MTHLLYPTDGTEQPTIGVDVSKRTLDVAGLGRSISSIPNTPAACRRLARRMLKLCPRVVAVEATGGYEQQLVEALWAFEIPVAILQPSRVRSSARADGQLAKSDRLDAQVIADFARSRKIRLAQKPDPQEQALRLLQDRRSQVVQDRVREIGRLEAVRDKPMRREIQRHIKHLLKLEADLDRRIAELIDSVQTLRAKSRVLRRMRGVGPVVATTLICRLAELGRTNRQHIAALAGLAPFDRDSGQYRGKRSIFAGRADVRRALYMAALSAIRHAGPIRDRYHGLIGRGKPPKVAIIACARTMLVALNAWMAEHLAEAADPKAGQIA